MTRFKQQRGTRGSLHWMQRFVSAIEDLHHSLGLTEQPLLNRTLDVFVDVGP